MHEYNSNMMSALYYFVIEPFLLPNNFNTKILNLLFLEELIFFERE